MNQCDRIFQIRLLGTTISLLMPLVMPSYGLALDACDSPCEEELHTKAAYLLEPTTMVRSRPPQIPSDRFSFRTINGPSPFADMGSSPDRYALDTLNVSRVSMFQERPTLLAQSSNRISVISLSEISFPPDASNDSRVLIAAPQNLNPGLYIPLFDAEEFNDNPLESDDADLSTPDSPEDAEAEDATPSGLFHYLSGFTVNDLDIDYQQNFDNFGGFEYGLQPTLNFENDRGDRIGVTTGAEIFDQTTAEQVINVPLEASWHRKIGQSSIDVSAGVDFFDRLPIAPRLSVGGSTPLFKGATLSGVAEYEPYKFNAQTLENEIRALRFGPNLFWQIAPNTSLFSLVRVGTYNDGNTEQQSFSRLEHRIGSFGIAANLFNWVYRSDMEMSSGYFSPQDFLVYSGELFWEDTVFNHLDCRASASLGRQRLGGSWTSGYSYGGQCAIPITQDIFLDVKYAFSNVRDQMTGESAFNSSALTSGLRVDF